MVLNFAGFEMLNESFKSSTIARLFKSGELKTNNDRDKALFNQVTEDEVLGVVNTKEEAQKLVHDTLGDKIETRYNYELIRAPYQGEMEWQTFRDTDHPYKVNTTVEEYQNWVFELNSGKLLVLRIDKDILSNRYDKIHYQREKEKNIYNQLGDKFKDKFVARKKYVEQHKACIDDYKSFKNALEEKGIWKEFIGKLQETLDDIAEEYNNRDDIEDDYCYAKSEYDNSYFPAEDDSKSFTIDNYRFDIDANFSVDCDEVTSWNYHPATYWEPEEEGGVEIEHITYSVDILYINVYDEENKVDVFTDVPYEPEYDKKNVIDFSNK